MSKDVKSISYIYKRKKSGTGSWKWSIVLAYGAANVRQITCYANLILRHTDKNLFLLLIELKSFLILLPD